MFSRLQTNRDPVCNKIYVRYNDQRRTPRTYQCEDNVFVWVRITDVLSGMLPVSESELLRVTVQVFIALSFCRGVTAFYSVRLGSGANSFLHLNQSAFPGFLV